MNLRYYILAATLILLQVLVFQFIAIEIGNFNYLHLLIYPLIILALPMRIRTSVLLLIAFAIGILVDIFYGSPGVHTSALVFTAFMRPIVIGMLEPREGYTVQALPNIPDHGIAWYLSYASVLLFLHHFFYFSVEAFTFVYFFDILIKTLCSFSICTALFIAYQYLFERKSK